MALFRRRGSERAPKPDPRRDEPDRVFPALSTADVAWIRSAAQRILAQNGVEVVVADNGADLIAVGGMRITIDNAIAKCRNSPRSDWHCVVEQHFGAMARAQHQTPVDELTPDELSAQIRTRLLPVDALQMGGIDMSGYARPIADDLAAVLCIDYPETVTYLDGGRAQRLDLPSLFARGQRNTDNESLDEVTAIADGTVTMVAGHSVFTASKALNMASLTADIFGSDAPYGVAFAVPDRHTVLAHLIVSSEAVLAISRLAQIAARTHENASWSVSPNVYHWYGDNITRISATDPERKTLEIIPSAELRRILHILPD
ncbi:MAG: hypothetical protein QM673_10525 [Gordonia sp. (in: high G+C Gram-positive bacteria)]